MGKRSAQPKGTVAQPLYGWVLATLRGESWRMVEKP